MRFFRRIAALPLLCGALAWGQETAPQETAPQEGAPPESSITVDVNVVNVPVTVTDADGRFVVDLGREDFRVFEDGEAVEIRYFTKIIQGTDSQGPPLRVGFLLDLSNTARLYYKTYKESIGDLAFLLVPEGGRNEGFLIGYHTEVDTLVPMTEDPYVIAEKMESLKHGGGSSMFDAIYDACVNKLASEKYMGAGEPRKAIVVVGDGHDNASKRSLEEVIYAAQLHQVTIYAVSTVAWGFHEKEEENLYRLARATGGRVVQPMEKVHKDVAGYLSKPQDAGNYQYQVGTGLYARAQLEALYRSILDVSGDVQNQYILGFTPRTPFDDGRFRRVRVIVDLNADIQVRHRPGYYPPQS